jgi:hypothetical protein
MRFFEEASKCSVCSKRMGYLGAKYGFGVRARRHEARCQARRDRKNLQVQETTVDVADADVQGVLEQVQAIFLDEKAPMPYFLKPSVQTWLAPLPGRVRTQDTAIIDGPSSLNAIVDKQNQAAAVANVPDEEDTFKPLLATTVDDKVQKPFYSSPSVGTWLAPARETVINDNESFVDASDIVAPGKAQDKEDASEQVRGTSVEEVPKPFYLRPSVGTWLARRDVSVP